MPTCAFKGVFYACGKVKITFARPYLHYLGLGKDDVGICEGTVAGVNPG